MNQSIQHDNHAGTRWRVTFRSGVATKDEPCPEKRANSIDVTACRFLTGDETVSEGPQFRQIPSRWVTY